MIMKWQLNNHNNKSLRLGSEDNIAKLAVIAESKPHFVCFAGGPLSFHELPVRSTRQLSGPTPDVNKKL